MKARSDLKRRKRVNSRLVVESRCLVFSERSHFERVLHAGASELTMGEVEGDQSSRKGCGSRSSRRLDVMKRDSAKSISSILPANLHWLGFSEFKR